MSTPEDLKYTAEHEWVRPGDGTTVRVGITDYAQDALGDIVYVQLPAVGAEASAGEAFGEVESTKSVSDIYAPVAGTVTARNEALEDAAGADQLRPVRGGLAGRDRRAGPGRAGRAAGRRRLPEAARRALSPTGFRHARRMTLQCRLTPSEAAD